MAKEIGEFYKLFVNFKFIGILQFKDGSFTSLSPDITISEDLTLDKKIAVMYDMDEAIRDECEYCDKKCLNYDCSEREE